VNWSRRGNLQVSHCKCDFSEVIITNGYVLSEVAMKTVSFTAAALLLVFTLLLTGSHP
jgi:hypothetical protein